MKIVIIGHVCIDKNSSEHASYVGAGSPAMFMQKIYRQFPGCDVTIVASYGKDFLLYKEDISFYPTLPNHEQTLIYENITKGYARTQKAYNRTEAIPVEIDGALVDIIKQADLLFFAPLLANFNAEYVAKICSYKNDNAQVALLPQGYYRNFDAEDTVIKRSFTEAPLILPHMNTVIVSEQDYPNITEDARKWSVDTRVISIVTRGEKGATAFQKGEEISLPTTAVPESEIVDSVGSGDIFSAGFAYQYRKTQSVEEAGRFANELAKQCLFYTSKNIKVNYEALI